MQITTSEKVVSREQFDAACEAVWTELQYQNTLPIRTADEAKDVAGFLTLLRGYTWEVEQVWRKSPGVLQPDGQVQVEEALHGFRKLAGICTRAMIYNGIRARS